MYMYKSMSVFVKCSCRISGRAMSALVTRCASAENVHFGSGCERDLPLVVWVKSLVFVCYLFLDLMYSLRHLDTGIFGNSTEFFSQTLPQEAAGHAYYTPAITIKNALLIVACKYIDCYLLTPPTTVHISLANRLHVAYNVMQ